MVPRIAARGHSFKGAGQYYLHDKKADTSERVAWTHTHNLPTDDPEKALRWMAHTAMNANRLKVIAGGSKVGRKSKAGSVYSFSLAWHPEQNPERETMLTSAFETLEKLGLSEHEAVMVAHNETDHPHVHVICNLVHPETGKTAVPSYDRLTLSAWAENVEKADGKVYCEERVINNEKRRQRNGNNYQLQLVKHREERVNASQRINELYHSSQNRQVFETGLQVQGYTLARGDRRGFVLVDEKGKITSLSRQLKGQRAKDLKTKLGDLKTLPHAQKISEQRQQPEIKSSAQDEHLHKLNALREQEQKQERDKGRMEDRQKELYKRDQLLAQIKALEDEISRPGLLDKVSGKKKEKQDLLSNLRLNLDDINRRIDEQNAGLKNRNKETKPDKSEDIQNKQQDYERRMEQHRKQQKNKDRDNDLDR